MAYPQEFKKEAQKLRSRGKTYNEIRVLLSANIPKSTLSEWCNKIEVPGIFNEILKKKMEAGGHRGRLIALAVNKHKRDLYLDKIRKDNLYLADRLQEKDFAKIALAMLYLGEGSKRSRGRLSLGNSDPDVIRLYLRLLQTSYKIDKRKLRCTVQCRADQKIESLIKYWSEVTDLPRSQFYKTQVDPRTIGKPSKKKEYRGVCRIDYLSGHLFNEVIIIGKILSQ